MTLHLFKAESYSTKRKICKVYERYRGRPRGGWKTYSLWMFFTAGGGGLCCSRDLRASSKLKAFARKARNSGEKFYVVRHRNTNIFIATMILTISAK